MHSSRNMTRTLAGLTVTRALRKKRTAQMTAFSGGRWVNRRVLGCAGMAASMIDDTASALKPHQPAGKRLPSSPHRPLLFNILPWRSSPRCIPRRCAWRGSIDAEPAHASRAASHWRACRLLMANCGFDLTLRTRVLTLAYTGIHTLPAQPRTPVSLLPCSVGRCYVLLWKTDNGGRTPIALYN